MSGWGLRGVVGSLYLAASCSARFSDGRVVMLGNIWLFYSSRTFSPAQQMLRFRTLL